MSDDNSHTGSVLAQLRHAKENDDLPEEMAEKCDELSDDGGDDS